MSQSQNIQLNPWPTMPFQYRFEHQKEVNWPDNPEKPHIHDCYEIYVNVSGDVAFLVNNLLYPVRQGDVIVTRPGELHICVYQSPELHERFCFWINCAQDSPLLGFLTGWIFPILFFVVFALVGLAWAAINVNSLPMVVEMCKGSEVGKFTGLYYTFSMSAQIATPIVAGWLLENISYKALFPYAAIFALGSFFTMGFVKHGDNKVEAKKGLEALEDLD